MGDKDYKLVLQVTLIPHEGSRYPRGRSEINPYDKERIINAIVASTGYKEMFEVERDPDWINFVVDDIDLTDMYP